MKSYHFQKSRPTFGLLINHFEGRYQRCFWQGALESAEKLTVNLMVFSGRAIHSIYPGEEEQNIVYQLAVSNKLDGLILSSGSVANYLSDEEYRKELEPYRFLPMVSISRKVEGVPSIMSGNRQGIKEVVRHLAEDHGYRKLVYIGGGSANPEAEERLSAFHEALAHYSIEARPEYIIEGDFSYIAGVNAVHKLLELGSQNIDAIVSSNDVMAYAILREFSSRGIRVPQDIAMTGYDDLEQHSFMYPSITTVNQRLEYQGKKAVELLLNRLEGKEIPEYIEIEPELIIRESCGCYSSEKRKTAAKPEYDKTPERPQLKAFMSLNDVEPVLNSEKENLLNITMQELAVKPSVQVKFRQNLSAVWDTLLFILKNNDRKDLFNLVLDDVLGQCTDDYEVHFWQKALLVLRGNLVNLNSVKDFILFVDDIFLQAGLHVNKLLIQRKLVQKENLEGLNWHLRVVAHQINSTYDREALMAYLTKTLPDIKVKMAFVCLYAGTVDGQTVPVETSAGNMPLDGLPQQSILFMALDERGVLASPQNSKVFQTRSLLPDSVIIEYQHYHIVFLPLCSHNTNFGYLAAVLSKDQPVVLEVLREHISTALETDYLLRKHEEIQSRLEAMVGSLQKSEERFREMSDLLPTAVVETDNSLRIVFINQAGLTTFGLTREEAEKKPVFMDLLYEEDKPRLIEYIKKTQEHTEAPTFNKFRFHKPGESDTPLICKSRPIIRDQELSGLRWSIIDLKPLMMSMVMPEEMFFHDYKLSPREREVLNLLIEGLTSRQIGERLFISEGTVKTHVKTIYTKIDVSNKNELFIKLKEYQVSRFGYQSYLFNLLSKLIQE